MTMSDASIINAPLRLLRPEIAALGAVGGIAVAISMLLVGADWFDHSAPSAVHFAALLALRLIAAIALTGELPDDPNAWGLLVLSLLAFAFTLPALLFGRR